MNSRWLRRLLQTVFKKYFKIKIRLYYKVLSTNIPVKKPIMVQPALFLGAGSIKIDDGVQIGCNPSPLLYSSYAHIEARDPIAEIAIAKNTIISNNARIIAYKSKISIGQDCRIGINFCCYSSDFHSLSPEFRNDEKHISSADIVIGDNVFAGNNVTILKGVSIGSGVAIGTDSVVTKSFPDNVIIAGIPAKIIKYL